MGFNTSAVIMNDALSSIEADAHLGKKIASAVNQLFMSCKPIDVAAGGFVNAITLVESHHADMLVPILVGGNYATQINAALHWSTDKNQMEFELLKQLANKHGYHLRKKPTRK